MSEFCSKCKKLNKCDVDNGECWCLQYPPLHSIVEAAGGTYDQSDRCLCERCFKEELKKQIDFYVDRFQKGEVSNVAPKLSGNASRPIQGIDYYMENGNWVFTSWSHMKRGYCCGSGCRHCPYPKEKAKQH